MTFKRRPGSGALRSSASDLLLFLAAHLGSSKPPLAPAIAAMLKVRRPNTTRGTEMALGWVVALDGIVWRNGSTAGYRYFVGYEPKSRAGVVVLSNIFTNTGLNDIGIHLLGAHNPLARPPKAPAGHESPPHQSASCGWQAAGSPDPRPLTPTP